LQRKARKRIKYWIEIWYFIVISKDTVQEHLTNSITDMTIIQDKTMVNLPIEVIFNSTKKGNP
jgi:hypothetical protein